MSVPARLSATLVLVREHPAAGMQVFMQVRGNQMSFAAGALVFPGGSVDEADRRIAAQMKHLLDLPVGAADDTELALRIAAIRETFEESGLLLAERRGGAPISDAEAHALHAAFLRAPDSEERFAAFLDREQLVLPVSGLTRFAHWVTPVGRPKRFDTHFFLARAPASDAGRHDGLEAVESRWIAPAEAVAAADAGTFQLMFPTRMNLLRLGRSASVADFVDMVRRSDIVTVMPEIITEADGKLYLRIPAEADYGLELFPMDLIPPSEREPRRA